MSGKVKISPRWNLRAESDSDTDSVTRGLSSSVQVCLCERARRRPSFSNRKCKSVQKEMAKMPYDPTTSARVPAWRLPRSVRLSGACGNVSGREGPNARKRSTFMHANSRRSNTCTVILCSLPRSVFARDCVQTDRAWAASAASSTPAHLRAAAVATVTRRHDATHHERLPHDACFRLHHTRLFAAA